MLEPAFFGPGLFPIFFIRMYNMKKFSVLSVKAVLVIFLCFFIFASCKKKEMPAEDAIDKDTSYAFGMFLAGQLGQMGFTNLKYDYEAFAEGFKAFNEAAETRISWEQMIEKLNAVYNDMQSKNNEKMWLEGEKNREEGEAYLVENRARGGVITTSSGLQYEVISRGSGATPNSNDRAKVHYEGTFINGEVFDSSYARGEPIEFPLDGVIIGWREGVQLMNEGSVYRFVIPSNLAYGQNGAGSIPPNSTLIFKVELISVLK